MPMVDQLVPTLLADVFVVGVHGGLGLVHGGLDDLVEQLFVEVGVLIGELGLADLLDHLIDEGDDGLVGLVGGLDALEHDLVGDLLGAGLDHDDLLAGGGDGGVHLASWRAAHGWG